MAGRPHTLGPGSGEATARCLVVAEAPGVRGAQQTGVPLHGDHVGDHFERLLSDAGMRREDLFITNTVLCAPRTKDDRARSPSRKEIGRCAHFLRELVGSLSPVLVVTLGATALGALEEIAPHGLSLRHHVGQARRWHGRFLLPLYHPSSRAMIKRSWARQREDYALWRSLLYADRPAG